MVGVDEITVLYCLPCGYCDVRLSVKEDETFNVVAGCIWPEARDPENAQKVMEILRNQRHVSPRYMCQLCQAHSCGERAMTDETLLPEWGYVAGQTMLSEFGPETEQIGTLI
jgi:hypothetical protein